MYLLKLSALSSADVYQNCLLCLLLPLLRKSLSQTVWNKNILLHMEQSDLGPYCLQASRN